MAYREPSTQIIIYRDVPLDPDYNNTVYWNSETERSAYFLSKLSNAITLPKQMYQRIESNKMRVQVKYENIVAYNYMSIKNADFGVDWTFYCFITGANYVNEETSDVTYKIDVMTTFFFNFSLGQCWVEREHSSVDVVGSNIMPENVPIGDYVQNGDARRLLEHYDDWVADDSTVSSTAMGDPSKTKIVVFTGVDLDSASSGTAVTGEMQSNIYQGVNWYTFNTSRQDDEPNIDNLNNYLKTLTSAGYSDSVITIVMIPQGIFTIANETVNKEQHTRVKLTSVGSALNGYTPKNAKLFTYPYNYLEIGTTNGSDSRQILRYEYFNDGNVLTQPEAELISSISPTASAMMLPLNYQESKFLNRSGETTEYAYNNSVTLTNFPIGSYTIDGYRAWLAQNQYQIAGKLVEGGISAAGALAGGAVGGTLGANTAIQLGTQTGNSIISTVASLEQAKHLPSRTNGDLTGKNNSPIFAFTGTADFYSRRMSVRAEIAEVIDNYFTRYGYATNKLKTPNTHVRPHWNYVKTSECIVIGTLPSWAISEIQHIHNNGITYWMSPNEIGDYSLDNSL